MIVIAIFGSRSLSIIFDVFSLFCLVKVKKSYVVKYDIFLKLATTAIEFVEFLEFLEFKNFLEFLFTNKWEILLNSD